MTITIFIVINMRNLGYVRVKNDVSQQHLAVEVHAKQQ